MARQLIASTKTIQAIKPGDPRKRLNDGDGLYLLLFVKGGSHGWRFDYTIHGRRKTLSLGTYPDVGLSLARQKADEARVDVGNGIDPSDRRKDAREQVQKERLSVKRVAAGLPAENSFEDIAREWYRLNARTWAASHASKIVGRFERDVFPWMGHRPITAITPTEALAVLKRVEARGALESAHRIHQICGQVFRFAIASGRAAADPTRDLRGALAPWKPEHYATITDPREVGQLLRDIEAYEGGLMTRNALRLAPLLFVRPGELRHAEWKEIDLDLAEWRIPARKMKARRMHIVPLSTQAVAALHELQPLTGSGSWVFPSLRSNGEPMSENTINAALRRMGYERSKMTAHGFRGMASTLLHEAGFPTQIIERQLAHVERDEVKAAYNHAEHLPARRKMMQSWADHLDALRQGNEETRATSSPNSPRRASAVKRAQTTSGSSAYPDAR